MWKEANKLPLNVEQAETVAFRRQNVKLNNYFKIRLDGTRLSDNCLPYPGVLLGEHLT